MSEPTNTTTTSEPATVMDTARARLAGTDFETATRALTVHATRIANSHATTAFLVALVVFGASWRVDAFIVDTVAVANALANLADGSLHISTVYYGPADAQTPGIYITDGRLYGRNYGQVVAALPVLYLLRGLSLVAAPSVLLAGAWSGALAVLGVRAGHALDDRRVGQLGVGLAALAFVANVAFGSALAPRLYPLVALQTVTLLAAAGLVATAYLLVELIHDHRAGVAAAVGTLLVGPVAFWATIPKRHAITAFLVLSCAYLLTRSRATGRLRDRALAYLPVGLTAWMSAPEGFLLLAALVPVDLLSARRRDPRALATVAAALAVGLLPFFLTNLAIAGNPLVAPRMLHAAHASKFTVTTDPAVAASNPMATPEPAASGAPTDGGASSGGDAAAGASASGSSSAAGSRPGLLERVAALATATVAAAAGAFERLATQADRAVAALAPDRLSHVFVRSGRIPGVEYAETGGETIELTLLESAPLLAALAAAPLLRLRRLAHGPRFRLSVARLRATLPSRPWTPAGTADLFAVVFGLGFTLVHLPRLPLHSTVTVRYLVPVVPLAVYGVVRLAPVRAVVASSSSHELVASALVAFAVGGAVWLGAFAAGPSVGTLMQAHAVVNLVVAALLCGWLAVAPDDRRLGAIALGLVVAAMALFLVATGFEYFATDRRYLFAVARLIETAIPIDPLP